jgi:Putative heavy-metal chelation
MRNPILVNTLLFLNEIYGKDKSLGQLYLTRYFTVVKLNDGSVGACMSYYELPDSTLAEAEELLLSRLKIDAFAVCDESATNEALLACIPDDRQRYLVVTSVTATIASALSSPLIRGGGDEIFEISVRRRSAWFDGIESALLVGFGGYLSALAKDARVKRIHVVDWRYARSRDMIEGELAIFRGQFPNKTISASSDFDSSIQCRDFDLVSITGSTLCNGTLEGILESARSDARILLNGQSASVHPHILFQSGICVVSTTVKPGMVEEIAARRDYSGEALRPMLEGFLPWIHLVKRGSSAIA